jgi:hypothetical protein
MESKMAQPGQATKTNKSYCFRGIRFQIRGEDLPEAVRESRHADLVEELVAQAREHAKALSGERARNGNALTKAPCCRTSRMQ